jgi:CDP-glucose 4,6-dehydratase
MAKQYANLQASYQGKRVLVTGHTGFKGSWLCLWLSKMGARVFGLAKDIPTTPSLFEAANISTLLEKDYRIDIRDKAAVQACFNEVKPDFVFHLAAQPIVSLSYSDPIETLSSNVMGTAHVLEALRDFSHDCSAVIVTSDKCYDNVEWCWGYREDDALGGKDIYSGSKGAAELVFKSYFHSFFKQQNSVRLATARAGNVIGGGDWADSRIVPDCVRLWNQSEAVDIRQPKATRPWQHVLEPLSGYLLLGSYLAEGLCHGQSFNFGPNADEIYTVENLVTKLKKFWPSEASVKFGKAEFHEAGLLKLCCDKALAQLNWRPSLSFDLTVAMTGKWYADFYQGKQDMQAYSLSQVDEYIQQMN